MRRICIHHWIILLGSLLGSFPATPAAGSLISAIACAGTAELGCVDLHSETAVSGTAGAQAFYSGPAGETSNSGAAIGSVGNSDLILSAHASAKAGSEGFAEPSAYGKAIWIDQIHPSAILGGYVSFNFGLTGDVKGTASVFASLLLCDSTCGPLSPYQELTGPGTLDLNKARFDGAWNYTLFLRTNALAGNAAPISKESSSDFSHTLTLISIAVYDENGNLLPDVVLQSESGFDYNPFLIRAVSEPSTLSLCAWALLAGLIYRTTRDRRGRS